MGPKVLFLFLILFVVIESDDSFLKLKCKHSKAQRLSPYCKRFISHRTRPLPTPSSSHQDTATTTHHKSIPEVVEEAEEEVLSVAVWLIPILGVFLFGYGGGVLYLKCYLKMSVGRSFLLGLNCQCVRGQFNPDAANIPLQIIGPQNAPPGPAIDV